MQPRRGVTLAAVLVCAVKAGTMESSSGREMATPTPLSSVRRDKCFLVTIVMDVSSMKQHRGLHRRNRGIRRLDLHAERRAFHDARHQIGKTVMASSGARDNGANRRLVVVVDAPAQSVGQQLLSQGGNEYIRAAHQCGAQGGRPIYL